MDGKCVQQKHIPLEIKSTHAFHPMSTEKLTNDKTYTGMIYLFISAQL
jgi:hypothetical protein